MRPRPAEEYAVAVPVKEPVAVRGVCESMKRALALLIGLAGLAACMQSLGPADPNGGPGFGSGVNINGGGTSGGTPTPLQVTVGDNFFAPAVINATTSDTITWTWKGSQPHSVTFSDGVHDSGVKTTGTYKASFKTAGTYNYHSTIRGDSLMTGQIGRA